MWAKIGPTGVLDHPSRIFLLDPRGHQREIYNLEFLKPDSVLQDVRGLLAELRRNNSRRERILLPTAYCLLPTAAQQNRLRALRMDVASG